MKAKYLSLLITATLTYSALRYGGHDSAPRASENFAVHRPAAVSADTVNETRIIGKVNNAAASRLATGWAASPAGGFIDKSAKYVFEPKFQDMDCYGHESSPLRSRNSTRPLDWPMSPLS